MLERLAGAVEAEVGPVLADASADQAGLSAFSFLAASVLAEADAALAAALPGAGFLFRLSCTPSRMQAPPHGSAQSLWDFSQWGPLRSSCMSHVEQG